MFKSNRREIQAYRKRYEDGIFGGPFAPAFKFDLSAVTFTPNMDKRAAPGPFATAPIVQGKFDGSSVPDVVSFTRGDQIHYNWYGNFDPYQGSIVFWWTPEKDRDAGQTDDEYILSIHNEYFLRYEHDNQQIRFEAGNYSINVPHTTVAGTTYFIVARWGVNNTLDGTNYACVSINDVHTYGQPTLPSSVSPNAAILIGGLTTLRPSNAIIEGFTIYRRPLLDANNRGVAPNWDDSGPIDEIGAIYAAGAGQDPCLVTGSWDVVFCLPTNSTAEALTTGTGEAWSHPHSSGVLQHQWLEDGGYLGRPWAVLFNGTTTSINCGSGGTLDDLADNAFTAEAWIRADSYGEGSGIIVQKGLSAGTGWRITIHPTRGAEAVVKCATTDALTRTGLDDLSADGKWHHVTMFFDDAGDRKIYIAIDGVWVTTYSVQNAGVDAIVPDAAEDLTIGSLSTGANTFGGCIGWAAISNNDRYSHGTDFIPPRQPIAPDVNHVEMWHLDEGTLANIAAEVTSPGNDGTLSNGTWEEQWDIETSPIVPYSVEFDGSTTRINCGSGASIDNLPSGDMTVEGHIRPDDINNTQTLVYKGHDEGDVGWQIILGTNGRIICQTRMDNTNAYVAAIGDSIADPSKWLHFACTWDNGNLRWRIFINGIETTYSPQTDGVGNPIADAAVDLYLGSTHQPNIFYEGAMGGGRISDTIRYTDTFTPPSRLNPPGTDVNTMAQWNFRDGPGTIILDETANNNDGTITAGVWHITPDQEIDSPGERIYQWGYVIGNDAVDEGITQIYSGLDAGENYVVRAVGTVEAASRGRNKLIVYDETNSAQITALEGPSYFGQHDGGAAVANLTDTTARWPQMLVGWTVYNITDGSSCVCTAISGDFQTITTPLSGGTDDLWDVSDEYRIVPPGGPGYYDDFPWAETFTFELPTIARNGAAADCVSISFKMVNGVNEGVLKWAQVELLGNLVDNPSLETGVLVPPWIPDGWTNQAIDAGDTVQELATVHSGAGSMEWNVGATDDEIIYQQYGAIAYRYFSAGGWFYGDDLMELRSRSPVYALLQYSNSLFQQNTNYADSWLTSMGVWRTTSNTNNRFGPGAITGATVDRFSDDIYLFHLDDVSLTVTPANLANSTENGGLRVDGRDAAPQPIPAGAIGATSGHIKWKMTPRHGNGDLLKFGVTTAQILTAWFGAVDYIYLWCSSNTNITLNFVVGAASTVGNWTPTNLAAGVEQTWEIVYNAIQAELIVDGVVQITLIPGAGIDWGANIPTTMHWGTRQVSDRQADVVFSAP